jgi:adenosylhomocysteine nucleosidase
MILVTACFPIESRWIARRPDVRVVRTATGKRSRETLDGLGSETSDASLVIATGFCGGIDPRARRGELFLARFVGHGGEEIHVDPELLDRARHALDGESTELHVGRCESVDHVLRPDEKRALAADGVVAVDMESGPLARWAADRGIPFIVLRIVLDPAGMALPFSTARPFWASALRHPVAAVRVARGAIAAGRVLGTAVDAVIETLAGRSDA